MILMPWFVVVHPYSTLSDCRQLATPQNVEVQKTEKFGLGYIAAKGRQNKPIETKLHGT